MLIISPRQDSFTGAELRCTAAEPSREHYNEERQNRINSPYCMWKREFFSGNVQRYRFDPKDSIKRLEEFVISVKGVKMMHGDMRVGRAEFWQMFDSSLYEWIRVKYNCKEAFLDVYDKICMAINC